VPDADNLSPANSDSGERGRSACLGEMNESDEKKRSGGGCDDERLSARALRLLRLLRKRTTDAGGAEYAMLAAVGATTVRVVVSPMRKQRIRETFGTDPDGKRRIARRHEASGKEQMQPQRRQQQQYQQPPALTRSAALHEVRQASAPPPGAG